MKKKSEKTALDLRVELFCKVAAVKTQANVFSQQVKEVDKKIGALEKSRTESLEKLVAKCRGCIQTDELRIIVDEIDATYKNFQSSFFKEKSQLLKERESAELKVRNYSHEAYVNFKTIINEVQSWQFGRGKLIFGYQGVNRVFGIIEELEEVYHCMGYFLSRKDYISSDDVKKITEACICNQKPLIHVNNIDLMPLNQCEVDVICKDNVNYDYLKKHIPKEMFPWRMPFVYLLRSDHDNEVFIAPLNQNEVAILQVYIMDFPVRRVEVIGKVRRDEENLREISMSSFKDVLAEKIQKINLKEKRLVIGNLKDYHERKFPGIVFSK